MKLRYLIILSVFPLFCSGQKVKSFKQDKNGVSVTTTDGILSISPMSDNAVRIKLYKETEAEVPELIFTSDNNKGTNFKVSDSPSTLEIKTDKMKVLIDKESGNLSYADLSGKVFLSEKKGSRIFKPATVMDEPCFFTEQSFESPSDEFIFGLGQFQDGQYNLKGISRRLTQVNSQIAIPFIFSSKGYGLLWHQYGLTDFNPADNFISLEKQEKSNTDDNMAEVTTTSGTQRVSQNQSLYLGGFSVPTDGEYSIFLDLGNMGNRHLVVIDGETCIDQSNMWLPPTAGAMVKLKAGEHKIQVVCKSDNNPKVFWKIKENVSTFRSPHAQKLDYVVFYGPSADEVISTYRDFSGQAPMLPIWAYGFWQCRERYASSNQLVETVKEFRKRKLPMDVIVQDWQYWGKNGWGVPQFDEANYPNPKGFIKELHDLNAHLTVSIWSNPDKNSEIGKEYVAKDRFIPNTKWLDYFNPETSKEYWNTLKVNMFDNGVDAWWMDAVEPENDALTGERTYAGIGDFYRLTYPLMVSKAVYEGQREASSDKRVCILTRSAFLGQQRYGVINWSGDIGGTWDAYRRQIVAGLNYTITGLPYWTTDIGGFFRPGRSQYNDEKFHELLIRWYQWGTFNPIFRIHGYMTETEPWKYGQNVEANMRKMLNLRYNLLPFIYSEAWQISENGSTMMRPLVMDFANDKEAISQAYEYMFGKNILVAPITEPDVKNLDVYLPKSAKWYDFWTGETYNGGQTVNKETPMDIIPLYVKAGSIIPFGPVMQYSTEKKWDNIEIRIYKGADGEFTLYEDEGDNYNYEKGVYATIHFQWDDAGNTLTIGKRSGSYTGMIEERSFNIILVSESKGVNTIIAEKPDKTVAYKGKAVKVKL